MDSLKKAEIRVNKLKKENGYEEQKINCCQTCDHSRQMSIEDTLTCYLLKDDRWAVDNVSVFGICNCFKIVKN